MLTKLTKSFLFIVIGIIANSCIEKFDPDIDDYDDQLVVHGLITNLDEPYIIRLSKTSPLDEPEFRPFTGATVYVEDDEGNNYAFPEVEPGIYQTNSFTGEVGTSYRLDIVTAAGDVYQSDYQELLNSSDIDSVYTVTETRPTEDPYYDEVGLQFYVSTQMISSNQLYYMWQLEETYEFNSDYPIEYTYSGRFTPYPYPLEFFTCWATNQIEDVFLFDASDLSSNELQKVPLQYVNTETRKLSIRYSLMTNQFVINEDTYEFFKSVQEMNSGGDLLYSIQPYQITGNIECLSNPDEKVLGLFWVAGKSSKRIFIDRPENMLFYYEICPVNTQGVPFISNYSPSDWPLYLTYNNVGVLGIVGRSCVDCTQRGGFLAKPDFWIDK